MDAWATLPLAAKPERRQSARNPNWTLAKDEQSTKRTSNVGVEMEEQRRTIEGTRCALKQFAARNQRIVADPFPNHHSFPRNETGMQARPQSGNVTSTRVTYNPALQVYQSRDVEGPAVKDRGLASTSCCFAVDPSLGSKDWKSTNLNVGDITAGQTKSQHNGKSRQQRGSQQPEWWGMP